MVSGLGAFVWLANGVEMQATSREAGLAWHTAASDGAIVAVAGTVVAVINKWQTDGRARARLAATGNRQASPAWRVSRSRCYRARRAPAAWPLVQLKPSMTALSNQGAILTDQVAAQEAGAAEIAVRADYNS